jgi:trk system potassium uptake protein TrkH
MILRPRLGDFKVIALYTGKVIIGIGLIQLIPMLTSLLVAEWNPAIEFFIGSCACLAFGLLVEVTCQTPRDLTWAHGLVVAGFSWILATVFGAIPYWLSGHFSSFLDAVFDVMSGFTTTGLYLVQDIDHLSHGLNMWRHILTFAGGQGIIVIALTFLIQGTAGAYKVYVGEGKDERLLPNVMLTARAIWLVSLVYMGVGTSVLWAINLWNGQHAVRAFLHGLWIFMGGWSTGGFAPQSYNTFYYHSLLFEIVCSFIFIAGSFNFALHWAVWTGKRSELRRNIEVISFFSTITVAMLIVTTGLMRLKIYANSVSYIRKMFFMVASGHTTTGFASIYSRAFVRQWGPLAMLGVIMAMGIGASACSTGGGFKGIRMGIIFKGLLQTIKKVIAPESAHIVKKWHHLRTRVLDDSTLNMALLIVVAYVITYALGALIGVFCGYEPLQALFESVSVGSNSGLSCGVTAPAMPAFLKITYIVEMWAGRLEFMSILALGGYFVSLFRRY